MDERITKSGIAESGAVKDDMVLSGAAAVGECAGEALASATAVPAVPATDAVAAVVDCLTNHPRHRELLRRALLFCDEPRARAEVEAHIAAQPEYAGALQEAFVLLRGLERAGGIAPVDDVAFADAGAPASNMLRTTPAGRAAAALLDPCRRLEACLRDDPGRADMLLEVLGFCRQPRRLADVREYVARSFDGRLQTGAAGHELDATYFIDRLAEAGALVWENRAWVATEDGERFAQRAGRIGTQG